MSLSHLTAPETAAAQAKRMVGFTDTVQVSKVLSALPAAKTWSSASPSGNSDLGLAELCAPEEPHPPLQPLQEPTESGLQAKRRPSPHPQHPA